jgi:hypothetical protein
MNFKDAHKNSSFITLFLILAFLLLSTSATAQIIVSISPEKLQVEENESFTMDITITPDSAIAGAELQLEYDPALISVTKISEGSFLKQGNAGTIFSKGAIDNNNGTVTNIYGVTIGKEMMLEPADFASIEFNSKDKAGISQITLKNVLVTNSTGTSLPVELNNGKVLIGDVKEEIPEDAGAQDDSKSAGQNSLLISAFAIVCISFLFMRR